ncbi:PH domain-containing protein [Ureibacillus acetophenoni]|uniref:PH (Pleckstrin Homology) domain-containing protein n=1 Tax=Ureibacillus acetophenoni TaxID=614649 RepID=A0A285URI5_9BACL|nr:PH domain-containing protein [Ureibacillus acetophenoni]SOC44383.1 PH (Pleckstrin Homology) domain-containing protein [Ureibacillus acetophenoni]
MTFTSKRDLFFGIIFFGLIVLFAWGIYESSQEPQNIFGIIIMSIMILLLSYIWVFTSYKIEEDILKITFGPFKKSIDIKEITTIRYTKNPFVAPALSINRLEINYGKYETISVSPSNPKQFLIGLQKINSHIQMKTN